MLFCSTWVRACPLPCLRHHMSADDWKASSYSLACSTKCQDPKSNCQLTPHTCNPKLPSSPTPTRPPRPWTPCLGHHHLSSYQNHILGNIFDIITSFSTFLSIIKTILTAVKSIPTSSSSFSLQCSPLVKFNTHAASLIQVWPYLIISPHYG